MRWRSLSRSGFDVGPGRADKRFEGSRDERFESGRRGWPWAGPVRCFVCEGAGVRYGPGPLPPSIRFAARSSRKRRGSWEGTGQSG